MSFNKRNIFLSLILSYLLIFLMSTNFKQNTSKNVYDYYLQNLNNLDLTLKNLEILAGNVDQATIQNEFKSAKGFYKKIEFIVAYHYPETFNIINAPNLLEADKSAPMEAEIPSGFQVLEEAVFDTEIYDRDLIKNELSGLRFGVNRLLSSTEDLTLTESNILDALKLNLYRLITRGISGFDSPVCLNSIKEAEATLESTQTVLSYFINHENIENEAAKAYQYLKAYRGNFNDFNRAEFISEHINPLCNAMYEYQRKMNIEFAISPPKAVAADVPNLFSENAFDLNYFAPANALPVNKETIELGKKLFYDNRLSNNKSRNCSSCHNPSLAFTDGFKQNESLLNNEKLMRNTPTLLNAALQPVQFYDSRISFIEDQAHEVISNREEMGGTFHSIISHLKKDKSYRRSFKKIFKDHQINERNIKSAIAVYVRSLISLNSNFDKYMRGNKNAMTQNEVKGFNIFMGKAKCGTCHYLPLFNGAVPPLFDKIESEVLGVPSNTDTLNAILDSDSGKYKVYQIPHQLFSFKTSTLRNIQLTSPYMHNGIYKTLEEVIDFYNRGGGAGMGIEIDNQTLPSDPLNLTQTEKGHLILFLKTLTDTSSYQNY